jgi:hypothetical protein
MRRPQFSLKTMLWLVLLVAGFFGGMALQRQLDRPHTYTVGFPAGSFEAMKLPDGTVWIRHEPPNDRQRAEEFAGQK